MKPFTSRVIAILQNIPPGQVMTYGQVAELAGSRRGARQVVRILHSSSAAHDLPWHRVVNAKGEIAIRNDEGRMLQQVLLQNEGVEADLDGRVDLTVHQFKPASPDD